MDRSLKRERQTVVCVSVCYCTILFCISVKPVLLFVCVCVFLYNNDYVSSMWGIVVA